MICMGLRKFVAFVVGVFGFLVTGVCIVLGVQSIWPGYSFGDHPIERLILLFICFMIASFVYNLIKGETPQEDLDKTPVTSEEISRKLEEKRDIKKK